MKYAELHYKNDSLKDTFAGSIMQKRGNYYLVNLDEWLEDIFNKKVELDNSYLTSNYKDYKDLKDLIILLDNKLRDTTNNSFSIDIIKQ